MVIIECIRHYQDFLAEEDEVLEEGEKLSYHSTSSESSGGMFSGDEDGTDARGRLGRS